MALTNGTYTPVNQIVVTTWPTPDANGDGDEVWDGQDYATDRFGSVIRYYAPPEGFSEVPTKSEEGHQVAATYVRRLNGNGAIKRTPSGEAINIYPGETLIEYPDGTIKKLYNEKERRLFEAAHSKAA